MILEEDRQAAVALEMVAEEETESLLYGCSIDLEAEGLSLSLACFSPREWINSHSWCPCPVPKAQDL